MTPLDPGFFFSAAGSRIFFPVDLFLPLSKEHHYSKSCMLAWIHNFQVHINTVVLPVT